MKKFLINYVITVYKYASSTNYEYSRVLKSGELPVDGEGFLDIKAFQKQATDEFFKTVGEGVNDVIILVRSISEVPQLT